MTDHTIPVRLLGPTTYRWFFLELVIHSVLSTENNQMPRLLLPVLLSVPDRLQSSILCPVIIIHGPKIFKLFRSCVLISHGLNTHILSIPRGHCHDLNHDTDD